jgi:hypothetical protein
VAGRPCNSSERELESYSLMPGGREIRALARAAKLESFALLMAPPGSIPKWRPALYDFGRRTRSVGARSYSFEQASFGWQAAIAPTNMLLYPC